MDEIKLVVKKSAEITPKELEEMHTIYKMIDPNMPENHILINHIQTTQPIFHLFKQQGAIRAFQAFTRFNAKTPFAQKNLPVVYINLSYKHPHAGKGVKDFAKRSNLYYIKEEFGNFWYFKRFVNVLQSYNPKLIQRLSTNFPTSYPNASENIPKTIVAFGKDFFRNQLNIDYAFLDDYLVKQYEYPQPSKITNKWESHYLSKDNKFSNWFLRHKIVLKDADDIFLSGRAVFFIGYFDPISFLKLKIKSFFSFKK